MRPFLKRRSAPKVHDGSVQHKNNWAPTRRYHRPAGRDVVVYRERPGDGFRHVLLQRDVHRFLALLPEWDELSVGLTAIVLATGRWDCLGWHRPGVVAVCAWERELVQTWRLSFFADHVLILDRLGVEHEPDEDEQAPGILCRFTEHTARGFLLMHILLHELGHHHDRMTTRSRHDSARGEDYAEQYALRHAELLWERYFDAFGW
jgi:hypothetical protein